nr:calmodulin-dependent protein kinase iv related protein [imported] - Neurospora crassa [Neurospora crassa]
MTVAKTKRTSECVSIFKGAVFFLVMMTSFCGDGECSSPVGLSPLSGTIFQSHLITMTAVSVPDPQLDSNSICSHTEDRSGKHNMIISTYQHINARTKYRTVCGCV